MDFNAYGFIPTIQRIQQFDFTIPTQNDQYRFLVWYPEEESRLWGPIRPFQLLVWVLFFISIVAVNLSLSWLMMHARQLQPDDRHGQLTMMEMISDNAVYICTIIANQAEYFRERKLFVRILVATWCLMALILVNSYTGNLTSYLSIPKVSPIPSSFEDVAYKTRTGLTVESKSVLSEHILVTNVVNHPF